MSVAIQLIAEWSGQGQGWIRSTNTFNDQKRSRVSYPGIMLKEDAENSQRKEIGPLFIILGRVGHACVCLCVTMF